MPPLYFGTELKYLETRVTTPPIQYLLPANIATHDEFTVGFNDMIHPIKGSTGTYSAQPDLYGGERKTSENACILRSGGLCAYKLRISRSC
jgi:hypothetical protein